MANFMEVIGQWVEESLLETRSPSTVISVPLDGYIGILSLCGKGLACTI